MKKIIVGLLVASALVLGFSASQAAAQGMTLGQLVELFISLGIISPDKAAAARAAVAGSPGVSPTATQPTIALVGTPSITKTQTPDINGQSGAAVSATFNIMITAKGGDYTFDRDSFSLGVYKNGERTYQKISSVTIMTMPSSGVTVLSSGQFKLSQNNSMTLPVMFQFTDKLVDGTALAGGLYAVGLEYVNYGDSGGKGTLSFMSGNPDWRTKNVSIEGPTGGTEAQSITITSPNGGTWTKGQKNTISWQASSYPSNGYVALFLNQAANGPTVGVIKNIFFSASQPIAKYAQSYTWDTQTLMSSGGDSSGVPTPPGKIQSGSSYQVRVAIIDQSVSPATLTFADSKAFTIRESVTSPIRIYWNGGTSNVQVGLVDTRFSSTNPVILGWISLENPTSGNIEWDGKSVTDLANTVTWEVSSLSSGPFRIVAVTADKSGNYCVSSSSGECNSVFSDYFKLPSSGSTFKLPTFASNSKPSITVTSPNGGEVFNINDNQIKFTLGVKMPSDKRYAFTAYLIPSDDTPYKHTDAYGIRGYSIGGTENTGYTNGNVSASWSGYVGAPGKYKLRVYMGPYSGDAYPTPFSAVTSDESNSYFKVVAATSPTQSMKASITSHYDGQTVMMDDLTSGRYLAKEDFAASVSGGSGNYKASWTFDDPNTSYVEGGQNENYYSTGGTRRTSYIFNTPGTWKIGLSVVDDSGNSVSAGSVTLYVKSNPNPPVASTCTDSDGGQNPDVAGLTDGRVNGLGSYFNDVSVASNGGTCSGDSCTSVAEGYCTSDGKVMNILTPCYTGYSANGACATKPVAAPISVSPSSLNLTMNKGQAYSQPNVVFTGSGSSQISWQMVSGSLPPGTVQNFGGTTYEVLGTPTQAGTYTFQLKASDFYGKLGSTYVNGTITVADQAPTGSLSVSPSSSSVASGAEVTLNYTTHSNAVSAKLYLSCPAGVSAMANGTEYCNTWYTFPMVPSSSRYTLTNTTTQPQNVIPNFYEYLPDNPNFAHGVSSQVVVSPAATTQGASVFFGIGEMIKLINVLRD
ncbi:MAG: hypothetical protein WC767_00255 [Candidatus Paceibacterota bacterium]